LEFEIELETDFAIFLIRADALVAGGQDLAIDEWLVEIRCRQSFLAAAGPPALRSSLEAAAIYRRPRAPSAMRHRNRLTRAIRLLTAWRQGQLEPANLPLLPRFSSGPCG
jgi:hypothetical protein